LPPFFPPFVFFAMWSDHPFPGFDIARVAAALTAWPLPPGTPAPLMAAVSASVQPSAPMSHAKGWAAKK
jgi:hypothetical protein